MISAVAFWGPLSDWRWLKWRMMFSTMTPAPSTTMPKSRAPSDRRLAGMWLTSSQMEAKTRENGIVRATMREGHDPDAWGEDAVVQFLDFSVNGIERGLLLGALAHQHDALDDVRLV